MKLFDLKLTNTNKFKMAEDISYILTGFDVSTITATDYDELDYTFVSVDNEREPKNIDSLEFVEQYGDWYYGVDITDNTGNGVLYIWKSSNQLT